MRRALIVALIVVLAATVIVLRAKGPAMFEGFLPSPDEMYPPAPPMPPVVSESVEDLLAQYEAFLRAEAPAVFAALQPGLTDVEIDKLEQQHDVKLPDDLRALYRWRNGTPHRSNLAAFPDHEFVPFDVALANRDSLRQQVNEGSPQQQQVYEAFVAHRNAWLGLIVDPAGDGYFFDPGRSESEGSFFFCFAEDGSYVFYPAFRNYLAAVVESQKAGILGAGQLGVQTGDFERSHELQHRYGAMPPY